MENNTTMINLTKVEEFANAYKKKLLQVKAVADNSEESTESRIMVIRQMLDNMDFIKPI